VEKFDTEWGLSNLTSVELMVLNRGKLPVSNFNWIAAEISIFNMSLVEINNILESGAIIR
jgi:hypothetical protein